MEVTDAIRDYAEKKITRLEKFYNRISEAEVVLDSEGMDSKVEIIIKADNHQRFVVTHSANDMYACIDASIDKIERQLTRHKEKSRNHKGHISAAEAAAEAIESQNITTEPEQNS
jgi:putative sigma-54 modulation protein